jgi:hypothetical protein
MSSGALPDTASIFPQVLDDGWGFRIESANHSALKRLCGVHLVQG